MGLYAIEKLMAETRRIAAEYRKTTGKTLGGVSGEIAEYDAARLLDLKLCMPKKGGYDAVGMGDRKGLLVQIKGRTIFNEEKSGQRVGQLKLEQPWDHVVLVLMNEDYEPFEIYEATRGEINKTITESNHKSSKRGAITVAKFKIISSLVWTKEDGLTSGLWDNKESSN